ncbi:hypothetical protein GCM10028808_62430 [Spirosoma migulaei]
MAKVQTPPAQDAEELKDILAVITELKGLLSDNEAALASLKKLENACRKQSKKNRKRNAVVKPPDRERGKDLFNNIVTLERIWELVEKHSNDIQHLGQNIYETLSNSF